MRLKLARFLCRWFGHKLRVQNVQRANLTAKAVGCTRCSTLLGFERTSSPPRMTIPRNR